MSSYLCLPVLRPPQALPVCFCLSICLCLCASPGSSDPVHPTYTRSTSAVQFSNILRWHTLVCPPLTARSLFLQPGSYVPGLLLLPSLLSTIYIQSVLILHFLMSRRNIPLTHSSLTPTLHLPICRSALSIQWWVICSWWNWRMSSGVQIHFLNISRQKR